MDTKAETQSSEPVQLVAGRGEPAAVCYKSLVWVLLMVLTCLPMCL